MKPILFNTDMVRAILDSHKTVTRRVVKPQPVWSSCDMRLVWKNVGWWREGWNPIETITWKHTPYRPGDILYVRETFFEHKSHFYYKADGKHEILAMLGITFKWRPSIHMPREAARIFLRVTDVRVERLQEITEEQVILEGFEAYHSDSGYYEPATLGFVETWDSTIKKTDHALYGWDANPWVWVIEFEHITREEAIPNA